jgi:hypothetical protein
VSSLAEPSPVPYELTRWSVSLLWSKPFYSLIVPGTCTANIYFEITPKRSSAKSKCWVILCNKSGGIWLCTYFMLKYCYVTQTVNICYFQQSACETNWRKSSCVYLSVFSYVTFRIVAISIRIRLFISMQIRILSCLDICGKIFSYIRDIAVACYANLFPIKFTL